MVDSQLVRFTLRHFQLTQDGTVFIVGGLSHPPWTLSKLTRRPRGGGQQANFYSKDSRPSEFSRPLTLITLS